jgi:hypothetical protein
VEDDTRETLAASTLPPLQTVALNLDQPVADHVQLQFGGLRPGETVWIYELNVAADDWDW